jgi:hypothetical protein
MQLCRADHKQLNGYRCAKWEVLGHQMEVSHEQNKMEKFEALHNAQCVIATDCFFGIHCQG